MVWDPTRLDALKGTSVADRASLEARLSVMDMQDRWQVPEEDNVDSTHPLEIDVYVPPQTKLIKQVVLRVKLKEFRSYGATTATLPVQTVTSAAGGASVTTSDNEEVEFTTAVLSTVQTDVSTASHNHGITDGTALALDGGGAVTFVAYGGDSHAHEQYIHRHDVVIPNHTHNLTIPEHFHAITHGIYVGAFASGARIVINGTDRTSALTGGATFNTDQNNLDVTAYMTATGYNTIEIHSATIGRVRCTAFVHLYVRGG